MKNIFVDIYLAFNLGDDLFLDILLKRYPDTLFTVNYPGTKYDAFLAKYPNVKKIKYNIIHKIFRKFKIYDRLNDYDRFAEEHDALLFLGGSIFREESYHEELYRQRMRLVNSFFSKKRKIFVISANFGPFFTQKFINDYRQIFNKCEDVCFRDSFSYDIFRDMPQIRIAPDIVFTMKSGSIPKQPHLAAFSIVDFQHSEKLIMHQDEYVETMIKLISFFISKGYQCRLFSFCENEGDMNTIEAIKTGLGDKELENTSVHCYVGNLNHTMMMYAECSCAVSARFHACVLSLIFGQGLYPIIYSNKTADMLRDIGLGEIMTYGSEIGLLEPNEVFHKIFNNKKILTGTLAKSQRQFEILDKYIN